MTLDLRLTIIYVCVVFASRRYEHKGQCCVYYAVRALCLCKVFVCIRKRAHT